LPKLLLPSWSQGIRCEVVKPAAIVQDDISLIKPILVTIRMRQNILTPIRHSGENFFAQRSYRYRVNQGDGSRPSQKYPMFAYPPPDHKSIAVIGLVESELPGPQARRLQGGQTSAIL
jgi:hypothetical protein